MPEDKFEGFKARFATAIQEDIGATLIDVLILGPTIERNNRRRSAKLRRVLLERCSTIGGRVIGVIAEHRELIKVARKELRGGYNLCSYEKLLAKQCDLVILLPDSAGSFAELGLFALDDSVCQKSLILFSRNHKNSRSFIMEGPQRAYRMRGATIKYVDYSAVNKVLLSVRAAIDQARMVKADRQRFGRG
jgi:hypothetical protein